MWYSFFGVRTVSSTLSGKSAESSVLGSLVLESKVLNDLGSSVHILGEVDLGG